MFSRTDLQRAEQSGVQYLVDAIAVHESRCRHSAVARDDPAVVRRVVRMLTLHAGEVQRQALRRLRAWSLHDAMGHRLAPVAVSMLQPNASAHAWSARPPFTASRGLNA